MAITMRNVPGGALGKLALMHVMLLVAPASSTASAAERLAPGRAPKAALTAPGCPNRITAVDLCDAVAGQVLETDPAKHTRYVFQTKIYAASCVNPMSDAPDVVRTKIQAFWRANQDHLTCSQINFSVRNGSVLKLGVERNSRDFINDAVRKWRVDLNRVDSSDGRTVLDYIDAERAIARKNGASLEPILGRYFDLFRSHGAKFARELRAAKAD